MTRRMAELASGERIIKLLTPDQMNKALAEYILARGGYMDGGDVNIKVDFVFTKEPKKIVNCRVEILKK